MAICFSLLNLSVCYGVQSVPWIGPFSEFFNENLSRHWRMKENMDL
jgi:hypothetical protein